MEHNDSSQRRLTRVLQCLWDVALQPARIARAGVLRVKLHGRTTGAGDDVAELVEVAMTTSFLGSTIRSLQRTDELTALVSLIAAERPRFSLEIGTAAGGTLFLLCRTSDPEGLILSVDLPRGPYGGGYRKHREKLYRSFAKEGQRLVLIRGDSHSPETHAAVVSALEGAKLDLLIVDGDRTYEGVKRDWQDYGPLVRTGGVVAFHDVCHDHPVLGDGVARFWDEVSEGRRTETFVTKGPEPGYGFGIIYKE
ncbi:MAG: class I SAM-dependent methyltransferase [Thermoleophilia bacterium]|nr:class I SAM-dependent methyltransferase [Thermoleophilia bacterium]